MKMISAMSKDSVPSKNSPHYLSMLILTQPLPIIHISQVAAFASIGLLLSHSKRKESNLQ